MKVVLYTKLAGGCRFCNDAKEALEAKGIEYDEVAVNIDALSDVCKGHDCSVVTFPRVVVNGVMLGGFRELQDMLEDELLMPNADRFVYYPIKYGALHDLYKQGVASFWTPEEIDLTKDSEDFATLSPDEQRFIKLILGFFSASDGIVNENIVENMCSAVQAPEARAFYSFQVFNEMQHSETYALLLDTLVKDPGEKASLFDAVNTVPSVGMKAAWAMKWLNGNGNVRFSERLVAFAAVEGILFSSSFCAIFWLRKRGLMPGLSLSNDFISRDEGLHQRFACVLFTMLKRKPEFSRVLEIVKEAVDVEKAFVRELLSKNLIGINAESMCQYVEYVADNLLVMLGFETHYRVQCPFDFMVNISLGTKVNFFETRNSSYQKANMSSGNASASMAFSLDADF